MSYILKYNTIAGEGSAELDIDVNPGETVVLPRVFSEMRK